MARKKPQQRLDSWKWYGVRSLYRFLASGKPRMTDSSFVPGATLVEERIVLIKARNGKEALRKAEKEGRAYALSIQCTNGYGQKVRVRLLKAMDAYELFEFPSPGAEAFSTTEEIDSAIPDEEICKRPIGLGERLDKDDPWRRFKFVNVEVVRLMLEHGRTPPFSCPG